MKPTRQPLPSSNARTFRTNFKSGCKGARGQVLVTREGRESRLAEYDRSGMSGVKFAQYVGIKYSTLASWLQSRRRHRDREKLLLKAGTINPHGRQLAEADGNATLLAKTPYHDALYRTYPWSRLSASRMGVGLPEGQQSLLVKDQAEEFSMT